jgi:hypothetical protein
MYTSVKNVYYFVNISSKDFIYNFYYNEIISIKIVFARVKLHS